MELYKALSLVRLEQDAHLASNYQGRFRDRVCAKRGFVDKSI